MKAINGGLGKGPDCFLPPGSQSPPGIHVLRQSGDVHHLLQGQKDWDVQCASETCWNNKCLCLYQSFTC